MPGVWLFLCPLQPCEPHQAKTERQHGEKSGDIPPFGKIWGKYSFEERLYAPLKPKTCLSLFQTLLPQAQVIEISNKVE